MRICLLINVLILCVTIFSCTNYNVQKEDKSKITEINNDTVLPNVCVLDTILKKRKLRAITDYGSLSYLIYRGAPIGYQYEMLKALTGYLNVDLELISESDMHKSIDMLDNDETDLLAMGLTVTNARKQNMCFTEPIFTTRQVLIQRKPDGYYNMATADEIDSYLIRKPINLGGKSVYVQKGTVFSVKLRSLSNDIGDSIHIIEKNMEMEELIEAVANDSIDYTIADEHIAVVLARTYPNIDVKTAVSFNQIL